MASIVVMVISPVWTMSRSGIASFTCAVGCFAWLMARRRDVRPAKRIVVIATLGAVLLVGLNWRGVDRLVQWFADTFLFATLAAAAMSPTHRSSGAGESKRSQLRHDKIVAKSIHKIDRIVSTSQM